MPSDSTAAAGEAEALDVLTHIMGSGSTSRLYRRLVMEKGIAASAGAWYMSSALDNTRMAGGVRAEPGRRSSPVSQPSLRAPPVASLPSLHA